MFHAHIYCAATGNKLWTGNPRNKEAAKNYVLSSMADGSRDCHLVKVDDPLQARYFRQVRRNHIGVDAFHAEVCSAIDAF